MYFNREVFSYRIENMLIFLFLCTGRSITNADADSYSAGAIMHSTNNTIEIESN